VRCRAAAVLTSTAANKILYFNAFLQLQKYIQAFPHTLIGCEYTYGHGDGLGAAEKIAANMPIFAFCIGYSNPPKLSRPILQSVDVPSLST